MQQVEKAMGSKGKYSRDLALHIDEASQLIDPEGQVTAQKRELRWRYMAPVALLSTALFALAAWMLTMRYFGASPSTVRHSEAEVAEWNLGGQAHQRQVKNIIQQGGMYGVSLGGWLCLEDWLNSGTNGSMVSTLEPPGQGQCLPPLLKHVQHWSSEGLLVKNLMDTIGSDRAIQSIAAYRASYISAQDLDEIAASGLKWVRLPLSWVAFADALAEIYPAIYGQHDPMTDAVLVPDPFYKDDAFFVTIPRMTLMSFIREAQKRGLKVILDMHNSPGGSQRGTYNGIWPLEPMFWKGKTRLLPSVPLTKLGILLANAMIMWIENLPPSLQSGIVGLSLMNEPGHMNALSKPFADERDILTWLEEAVEVYRASSLSRSNIKLYMSLIPTAFEDMDQTVIPWYTRTFSAEERRTWMVAELHYYQAWNRDCDGSTKSGVSSYQCGGAAAKGIAAGCAFGAAKSFRHLWGEETQVAINEFSLATYSDVNFACKDRAFLAFLLNAQLAAFQKFGFETSFWTWKTSLAYDFEPGWSLRWLLGLEVKDASMWCGSALENA